MSAVFLLIAILACGHINTSTATFCTKALDVSFVLDGSSSVCPNWLSIIGFVHNLASRFIIGRDYTQVGLVTFGDAPKVEFYLNKHEYAIPLLLDIDDTKCPGGELNQPGLAATMAQVFSSAYGARDAAGNKSILITDGAPAISLAGAEAASTALQNDGVDVYVICLPGCSEEFAQRLSSPPKQRGKTYFIAPTYLTLIDIFFSLEVFKQVCSSGDGK